MTITDNNNATFAFSLGYTMYKQGLRMRDIPDSNDKNDDNTFYGRLLNAIKRADITFTSIENRGDFMQNVGRGYFQAHSEDITIESLLGE